jgi:hypothetical protein
MQGVAASCKHLSLINKQYFYYFVQFVASYFSLTESRLIDFSDHYQDTPRPATGSVLVQSDFLVDITGVQSTGAVSLRIAVCRKERLYNDVLSGRQPTILAGEVSNLI